MLRHAGMNVKEGILLTIIETKDLIHGFKKTRAVDGLTLSIAAGELFGLVAPDGAGKTFKPKRAGKQQSTQSNCQWIMWLENLNLER